MDAADLEQPAALLLYIRGHNYIIMDLPAQPVRLIAIDIDGTLLNPAKQITERTREAIQAAQKAGIIVTLATARRYYNTALIAEQLGIDIPVIIYDGALIMEHPDGAVLHSHRMAADTAQQALEILVRYKVQPVVHHLNGTVEETWTGLAEFDTEWVYDYFRSYPHTMRRLPYDECCTGNPDPLRVVAFTSERLAHTLAQEVSTLALDCSWNITSSGSYGTAELAIMHKTCSKASGVEALARRLAIPLSQVMAIGDSNNDIEMLQTVGWGVAMGQATERVKAAAHAVTASNKEDGVALAIERYCFAEVHSMDRAG